MAVIRSSVISVTKKEYDTSVAQQTANKAKQETIEINKTLTEVDKRVSDAQKKADESLGKAQEGFDKAQSAIDDLANLKIGSNNLLPNSSYKYGFDNWEGVKTSPYFIRDAEADYPSAAVLEIVKTADGTTQKASTSFQVKNNNTYIISFDVKITGTMPTTNISLFAIRGFKDKNTSNSAANATKNVYVGKNDVSNLKLDYWHRVSIKFDTNADYLRIIPYNSDTTNTLNTQYRRIQVEEGNIATDWTESSSDVDKAVLLVDNKTGAIAGRVTDAEGNITSLTATAQGLQTEVKNKAEQSTVTQLADVVASKVSNADFESNKTQTAELISSTVSLQNNENIRYLRFSGSGNSVKESTHVLEIEANDSDNKNIALGILPVAEKGSWKNLEYVTDGVSNENDKYADGKSSDKNVSFVIDLKKIYQTLNSLQLWMYVATERVYYNVKLEVSTDKKTWKTVYFKDNYTPTKKGDTVILSNAEASSQISQLADNINLKVDTGDVINQINIDPKGIIISGKKISLDGDVSVLPGFKLKAETINGGTFNGNSFIKAIDIRTNDGNLPVEIKGKSSIDDAGIIIEQKTKDITSGGIISDSRSILNNGLTVGTALDAANGDRRIDYTKDYSQVSSSGIVTPNIVRTSDRAIPYWNGKGSNTLTDSSALVSAGIVSSANAFYAGVGTDFLITDKNGYNSGKGITYKPLIASQLTAGNLSLNGGNSFINKAGNSTWFVDGNGNRTDITCKTVSQSSLLSLKTDIEDVSPEDALADILATDVKQYRFIGEDTAETHTTFIIDDVNKTKKYNVPSQFLAEDKQGRDDGTVIGYLMLAIKAQNEQIKTLEKEKNNSNERLSKIESLLNLD